MEKLAFNLFFLLPFLTALCGISCSSSRDEPVFRIGAGNIGYSNREGLELSKAIAAAAPDIFICLEWTGRNLDTAVLKNSGYKIILDYRQSGTHGMCVLARPQREAFAALEKSPVQGPCRIPVAVVSAAFCSRSIVLMGVHAPPPVSSCKKTTESTIDSIAGWISEGKLNRDVSIGKKGDFTIVLGDFNALPANKSIKQMAGHGLKDCGFHVFSNATWSPVRWLPAFLRIDYIFAPSHSRVKNFKTFSLPGSDHRAVAVDLPCGALERK